MLSHKLFARGRLLRAHHAVLGFVREHPEAHGQELRYELFYWDYVIGGTLFALIFGLTAGNGGAHPDWGFVANLKAAFATLVSALRGIFVWKEFAGAPRRSHFCNFAMFVLFIPGLALAVVAGQ